MEIWKKMWVSVFFLNTVYKHQISYLTGTCYNFEMEEFFSSFLRRAGMPASAGLSCYNGDEFIVWNFGDINLNRLPLAVSVLSELGMII